MFNYGINPEANERIFYYVCQSLDLIEGMVAVDQTTDVDETLIQTYRYHGYTVNVFSDTEIDAVFIKSEIEISDLLTKNNIEYY